jgi:hypothetical protein
MGNAEAWVKLLYTYGPFAILVFFVFVTERKTRLAKNEAPRGEKRTLMMLYLLNWMVIFGLVIFSVYAWYQINVYKEKEQMIKGTIENLSGSETVVSRLANLYLHRTYSPGGRADFHWRIITDKPLAEGEKIRLTIDPSTCVQGEAEIKDYELTVKPSFYDKMVNLIFRQGKLFVSHDGKEEAIEPAGPQALAAEPKSETGFPETSFLTTVVHAQTAAQTALSPDEYKKRLESSDVYIRRDARNDLAKQGEAALPLIEDILADAKSSYRLKLGVIVALNNMPNLRADKLKPSSVNAIKNASSDPDEALRSEAAKFLSKYGSAIGRSAMLPVTVYEHINFTGRSQGFGPGEYRANKGQLGNLPNDTASSVRVAKGYKVRLCENEGSGNGAGVCEEYGEGSHQLKLPKNKGVADRVSYISVKSF